MSCRHLYSHAWAESMMRVAITSTQMWVGYDISLKYLSIFRSQPDTAGIRLPVYFSGISSFKPPILEPLGIADVVGPAIAGIGPAGMAPESSEPPAAIDWTGTEGVTVRALLTD